MKSVGRGPLGRGEAGVKVGDDDLGQMTSKSGEKTFLSRDEIFHVQSRGCESDTRLAKGEKASERAREPRRN